MTVRISPSVWVEVGRLSREAFEAIQGALEEHADRIGQKSKLPGGGELRVSGYLAEFEIDSERRVMTLTSVQGE